MALLLVRHADAVSRDGWLDPDELRPLTDKGRGQARALVPAFADFKVETIRSSPSVRCIETVAPLAAARSLDIAQDLDLAEGASRRAVALVRSLAGTDAVLCSHGDVIPEVLAELAGDDGVDLGPNPRSQKGSVWLLEPADEPGRFRRATYLRPASA